LGFRDIQAYTDNVITLEYTIPGSYGKITAEAVAVLYTTKYIVIVVDEFNKNVTNGTIIQTKLETTPSVLNLLTSSLSQPETYHLNYLSIPILLDAKLFKKLSIQAGPQYSILLDQKKDGIGNASMAFKNGEFAFVGGGKFDLGGFYLYGRYVVGLNSINELQNQNQWKTTQWQLGIGMSLLNF
jgi:hypothetical protein